MPREWGAEYKLEDVGRLIIEARGKKEGKKQCS